MLILLLSLFLAPAFAGTCETRFKETVRIQVFDSHWVPIEGAMVNITYQKDYTTDKGYVTTNNFYTDSEGKTEITIHNDEQNPAKVDCTYTVKVSYLGSEQTRNEEAGSHGLTADLQFTFEAYTLNIYVEDRVGDPISNAEVNVMGMKKRTDNSGLARYTVISGVVPISVKYSKGVVSEELYIAEDTDYTFQLILYNLKISVVDDDGEPLKALITADGDTYDTTTLNLKDLLTPNPIVTVEYGGREKEIPIDLDENQNYEVVFDTTPPVIENLKITQSSKAIKVAFNAYDVGMAPSGVDLENVKVTYIVEGSSYDAPVYKESGNKYIGEIPLQPVNTLVKIKVLVSDADENSAKYEAEFLITQGAIEDVNGENGAVEEEGFPWIWLVIGVIVIVIGYLGYTYIKGIIE